MGGKKKSNVVYMPSPAPTATPQMTEEQLRTQQQLEAQVAALKAGSEQQLQGMQQQYQQNAAISQSFMQQLQEQLRRQQEQGTAQQQELQQLRTASLEQTRNSENARLGAQAQYADARQQSAGNAASLFGRLQRRRASRRTTY